MLASIVVDNAFIDLKDDFSFVPTKSAIAFSGSNNLWNENIGCRDLVCTGETLFDSYYAPQENQEHAALYNDGVNWILQEIDGNHQNPSIYGDCGISSTLITGSSRICYNQTKHYQLSNSCIPNGVNWTVSNNLQVISSNKMKITVKSTSANTGSSWVKATFDNGQSIIKQLVGKPSFTYQQIGNGQFPEIELISQGMDFSQQSITGVTWSQTGGEGTLHAYSGSFNAYATGSGDAWIVNGVVKIYNLCGYTEHAFIIIPSDNGEPCNPQQQQIIIKSMGQNIFKVIDPCSPYKSLQIDYSELYDEYGYKIKDLEPQQDKVSIGNINSSGSIRIIRVVVSGKSYTKRIIVGK